MKIIDENGVELTTEPDLALGRLVDDTEIIHHDAIAAVAKESHWNVVKTYPNGSSEVEEVIDVEPVDAQDAWDETVPIQRYIRYTEEELAEQKAKEEHETKVAQLPETVEQLQMENEMLKTALEDALTAQTDTDGLLVDQEYRLTLLELGIDDTDNA